MPKSRIPSPARSERTIVTPRRYKPRRSRSVCSPAPSTTSGRLTSVIDQFKENNLDSFTYSPLSSRRSVLTDKTDIEEPRRKSWWKNLNDNSRDVMEVLDDNKITDANKAIEELFDIEVLRHDNKNYTLDLPDSSDNESIKSVVLQQKKLFTQNDNPRQKNIFGGLLADRETLNKFHTTNITQHDETVNPGTKNLFKGTNRPKPVFPAELLNISSPHETFVKNTKANISMGNKVAIKNLFGNKPNSKRKHIFAEFIASESEHELSDIQPKVFYFQKQKEDHRINSFSKDKDHFLTSSINNEMEPEDWKNLPSSTMVENQLDEMVGRHTPVKRVRLSKLLEIKESEAKTMTNVTLKTKELNNDVTVLNKSLTSQDKVIIIAEDYTVATAAATEKVNISNIAHNKTEVLIEPSTKNTSITYDQDKTKSKDITNILPITNEAKRVPSNEEEIEDDFTLEYEADLVIIGEKQNQGTSNQKQHIESKNNINNTVIEKEQNEKIVLDMLTLKSEINKSLIESTHNESLNQNKASKSVNKNEDTSVNVLEKQQVSTQVVKNADQDVFTDNLDGTSHVTETYLVERRDENKQLELGSFKLNTTDKIVTENLVCKDKETESCEEQQSKEVVHSSFTKCKSTENISQDRCKYQEGEITSNLSSNSVETINRNENEDSKDRESPKDPHEVSVLFNASKNDNKQTRARQSSQEQEDNINVRDETNKSLELTNDRTKEGEHIEKNQNKVDDEEVNQIQQTTNECEEGDHTEDEEHSNGSQELENDDESNESQDIENELNESQETENDNESEEQNIEDSLDDDGADTTDDVFENQEDIEVDNDDEQSDDIENSVTRNVELIDKSLTLNHDTADSSNKMKSPDLILHDKIHHQDSFTIDAPDTNSTRSKSMYNALNIRSIMKPARNSIGANLTEDSSAEGSGWDSHRTTRKTLRQTFGRDFTLRKSLRTLVLEKSAKSAENVGALHSESVKLPRANSTAYAENFNHEDNEDDAIVESDHEVSRKMRQTTLESYLQKLKQQNLEERLKMEESIRNSFKLPSTMDTLNIFKVPTKPPLRKIKPATNKIKKQIKSSILFDELPSEVIEDMKYKPPKRFRPLNASWITKRLYKFLEMKLQPKYDYRARVRAEKLVETIYHFTKELRRHDIATKESVVILKNEFARLDVVKTHFEFYEFFHEFMPREIRVKVVPDIVNKITLPRHGIFSDILRGNTVQR